MLHMDTFLDNFREAAEKLGHGLTAEVDLVDEDTYGLDGYRFKKCDWFEIH